MKIATQKINSKAFDDYRDFINQEFLTETVFKKKRLTQGLFWTDFDKDLANQYIREEVWIFGIKIADSIKLIDHCTENNDGKKNVKIGF